MKAQITKIDAQQSQKTGRTAYLVCFKCEDGKSRTSWVDTGYRNYSHWDGLLRVGNDLDNLVVKGNYIDADSYPTKIRKPEIEEPEETAEQTKLF
jgi:hypothetical protein